MWRIVIKIKERCITKCEEKLVLDGKNEFYQEVLPKGCNVDVALCSMT